ncbi:hypothetical protein [Cellvibrio sp.]|uniref:hypothetical protein n=1 Tax=Cellvibrio sp. TaxID=1965322 RepID=UPI00396485C2
MRANNAPDSLSSIKTYEAIVNGLLLQANLPSIPASLINTPLTFEEPEVVHTGTDTHLFSAGA